jgi:hypothetical protein
MAETVASSAGLPGTSGAPRSLPARLFGVIMMPRATYAAIAVRPRLLGAWLVVLSIAVAGTLTFLSTEVGRQAALDQQTRQAQAFGRTISDDQYAQMERMLPYFGYIGAAFQTVFLVVVPLLVAGLMFVVFNALLGGDRSFKQILAIIVHSGLVFSLQQLFVLPLDYLRESLTSPTTLLVFLPFLEETSFAARLLGALDLFAIWWMVNVAIGLGVLYKRRTGPIATGLLITYLVIALTVAVVRTMLSGS